MSRLIGSMITVLTFCLQIPSTAETSMGEGRYERTIELAEG